MRKLTVKMTPRTILRPFYKKIFKNVKKITLIELIKLDMKRKYKLGIVDITMNKGYTLNDMKIPKEGKILDIFDQKGDTYTVLIKSKIKKTFQRFLPKFDMDLIWTRPSTATKDNLTYSCIGDDASLRNLLKATRLIGVIQSASFTKADLKSPLTTKQKEILDIAKEEGYYQYPRKINATDLAKKLKIAKPTLIEHLRRIENKTMKSL